MGDRRLIAERQLWIELIGVLAALGLALLGLDTGDDVGRLAVISTLAFVMGMRNESIRRLAVAEMRTTVFTLGLTSVVAHAAKGELGPAIGGASPASWRCWPAR